MFEPRRVECPVCRSATAELWRVVEGFDYFRCAGCESIAIDPRVLSDVDDGRFIQAYRENYWRDELSAAKERSYGPALARVAEVLLYARRPVRRFLDVGAGPGYLLDALSCYLPASKDLFHGVELFPPKAHTSHPNYHAGPVASLSGTFDAGSCIEVVEHLTPTMLGHLLGQLAEHSAPQALFIVNSGLPEYVLHEDPGYMDPLRRGHIVSYSIAAMRMIGAEHGFSVLPLRGKSWAYLLEYHSESPRDEPLDRIWSALPENKQILHDPAMGSLLYVLGIDTARVSS